MNTLSTLTDAAVDVDGYTTTRRGRLTGGGGVLVYVPNCCRSWRRLDLEDDQVEAIWSEFRVKGKRGSILLCNICRPPSAATSVLDNLSHMVEKASKEGKTIIQMGDLNCNLMKCTTLTYKLTATMQDYNMSQLISKPTRMTANSSTLIDTLYTTTPDAFHAYGVVPLTGSDHLMIYGELQTNN